MSSWPAVSPSVLAVGGTTLTLSSTGARSSETGWRDSGGAYSSLEENRAIRRACRAAAPAASPMWPTMPTRTPASPFTTRSAAAAKAVGCASAAPARIAPMGRTHRHRQPGAGPGRPQLAHQRHRRHLFALQQRFYDITSGATGPIAPAKDTIWSPAWAAHRPTSSFSNWSA